MDGRLKGRLLLFLPHTKNPPEGSNLSFLGSESKQDLYRRVCAFICSIRNSSRIVPLQKTPAHKGALRDNGSAEKTAAQWRPDIIHSPGEAALSRRGGARLRVTGVRAARPPPPSPRRLHRRVCSTDARWRGLSRVSCNHLDGDSSCGLLGGNL